jgi:hypothetical protein
MSIELMTLVFKRPRPDNAAERLVLLTLADFANEHGVCWPSIRTLADRTRLSTRGVQKAVRKLETGGLLKIRTGGINSATGDRYANTYTLSRDEGEQCSPIPEPSSPIPEQLAPMNAETPPPEHGTGGRVNAETSPPEHGSSQPSGNPHKQPSGNRQGRSPTPSFEQVVDYTRVLGMPDLEARIFFDHFQANGWRQSGGNPIKVWQAAARNWWRRSRSNLKKTSGEGPAGTAFDSTKPNAHTGGLEVLTPVGAGLSPTEQFHDLTEARVLGESRAAATGGALP